jgi:hypothetical protein
MVDALASGASVRKDVEVRVLSWAPMSRCDARSVPPTDLCSYFTVSRWALSRLTGGGMLDTIETP